MAFFNKLNDLAKNVGEKTNEAFEITRLNSKISNERSAISEAQKKIGEYYYAKHLAGENLDAGILEFCSVADKSNRSISELQAQIAEIKSEKDATAGTSNTASSRLICGSCGISNTSDVKFCCECGAKLEEVSASPKCICPSCKEEVPSGVSFCGECGTKVEQFNKGGNNL